MSKSTKQYAERCAQTGRGNLLNRHGVTWRDARATVPVPPGPEQTAEQLRIGIAYWEGEAGRALARAADLKALLAKLEADQ